MREKELRLALVCYGGVSLAVYMHGITKEVWRLARASRAFHDGTVAAIGSEGVYRALLAEIEDTAGVKLRVLPDIVAGASAGAINGVFLAQAIATGQSLEPLTAMWLDNADITALLAPTALPARFSKLWALPLAWLAAGRGIDETVEPEAREEVKAKLATFVRARWFEPPFGGPQFTAMLLDALEAMAASECGPRLLPDGQPLDLFVTVTDFRGHPERLRLHSPPEVLETEHRLVLPFSDHGEARNTLAAIPELAFAARATSSFPGAFPPFTVGELDAVLKERGQVWPGRRAFLTRCLPRHSAAGAEATTVLIDGSVLANAPFRPAIEALRERPARREIDRRFVYVDPSPGPKFRLGGGRVGVPGFLPTILGALSELPRQQPIRDNLEALSERSARIARMREIVEHIRAEVEGEVEALFGYTLFLDRPTPARLAAWRRRAQQGAAARAGYGHAAYAHLKTGGVIDALAATLAAIAGDRVIERRLQMRDAVSATVAARGADRIGEGDAKSPRIEFLRRFDLGFRIRRLRMLGHRLSALETVHGDAELNGMREAIYAALAGYLDRQRSDGYAALRKAARAVRGDAGEALDALGAAMDLPGLDAAADARLAAAFAALAKPLRRAMLLAYLGFPYLDAATLPLLQGEGLDEFDPVQVDRIAPDDAVAIRAGGAAATLKGIQFNNFGAFFSRAYRENDYLWGRLHGADRLVDILVSTLPAGVTLKPGRIAAIKRAAFLAILDEEEPRLGQVKGLFGRLRGEIG